MPADDALERRIRTELETWRSNGLQRVLRPPEGVDLSSNDYLNLSRHPAIVSAFAEGVEREGCGSTGSRLLRGHRTAFEAIEERFATFKQAERSLFFSSGYLANLAVLTTLPTAGDTIFSDERNHASLIDGSRLSRADVSVFPHNDVAALSDRLSSARAGPSTSLRAGGIPFVVVESLFSMDGDFAPLAEYAALCRATGAVLVVDEAHAVGIYGERGSGVIEATGIGPDVCVSINTAGKALGATGAFVAGREWAIEYLVQRGRPFVFSTAPPPAVAAGIEAALTMVEREPDRRKRLLDRAAYLRARLRVHDLVASAGTSQIVPIIVGSNEAAVAMADALQQAGFDVRAIRPPTVPAGTARLRVSVNAATTEAELDAFIECLIAAARRNGLCFAGSS